MYSFKGIAGNLLMRIFSLFKIQDKIVFSCFDGKIFSDKPKALFEEIKKRNIPVKCVWIIDSPDEKIEGADVVKRASLKSVYELSTAKIWIDNSRKRYWVRKRKGQLYIQTWHGSVYLKALEKDTEETLSPYYIKNAINDSKMIDYFISECEWGTDKIKKAFWYNGEILKCTFRSLKSDTYFQITKQVKDFFKVGDDEKLILYVPTFRKTGEISAYLNEFSNIINAAKKRFGGDFKVIVRLHPNIASKQVLIDYSENVLNGTLYNSADDLIIASDIVISDYSGCIFDGYKFGKKVFIYAADINSYIQNDRKMYFDLRSMPSPVAENKDEMINAITDFNSDGYEEKRAAFVEKIGYYKTDATELIIEKITDFLEQNKL